MVIIYYLYLVIANRFNRNMEMIKKTIDGYYYDGKDSYTLYKDRDGKISKTKKDKQNDKRKRLRNSK